MDRNLLLGTTLFFISPTLLAQPLYSIEKEKIITVSKAHILAVNSEVKAEALSFRGLEYINRADNLGGDRLKVEFCLGKPIKSKADTFDLLTYQSVKPGHFNVVAAEVTAEGIVENAKIETYPIATAKRDDICLVELEKSNPAPAGKELLE